jgi:nucleoside recognition membrane protein YjiH
VPAMSLVLASSTGNAFEKGFATFLLVGAVVLVTVLVALGVSQIRARRARRRSHDES